LSELPPPPPGKTGWPWTEATPPPAEHTAERWPSIGIVTPSYNQGEFIEQTIRSVLLQGYPRLEYVVIDGGSTDNSADVIRKYAPWLTHWVSERDRGQSHAINKGFARLGADVVNWLNSDDILAAGALQKVGQAFAAMAETDVVVGRCRYEYLFDPAANHLDQPGPTPERLALMPVITALTQPSCFYRRTLLDRPQPIDESLHVKMDYDLWCYFHSRGARWRIIDEVLSVFQFSGRNKSLTDTETAIRELDLVYRRYCGERIPLTFWCRRLRHPIESLQVRYQHVPLLRKPLTALLHLYIWLLSPFYGSDRVRAMSWRWIPESKARWGDSPGA
jgi:glycosyltransferase involved in cell wall biosynthesis